MNKYGKHEFISKITAIVGTIVMQSSIYTLNNPDRFIDLIWIIIVVLYTFYTLNLFWGILVIILNFTGLLFYQVMIDDIKFRHISTYSKEDQIDYYLSIILGATLIIYLLILFFKTQNITNLKYTVANTKLRENNKIVKQQNQEKTVLLKEIHHRVKNNLQVITSLLRLQTKDIEDQEIIKQFNDATNRVIAMSLIHEKIYQSKDLSRIDISEYFKTLTHELIRSYSISIPIIKNIDVSTRFLSSDYMVPVALLLNELISNTLKHGIKDNNSGEIWIKLSEDTESIFFNYRDNGVWHKSFDKKLSFGLELIETLTDQLDGEFTRDTDNGTNYLFKFPINI